MTRRRLLRAALLLPLVAAGGCLGGGARAPHTWWVLEASGPPGTAEPDARRAKLSLVVEGVAAGALYDGTALVYSRGAGMRAPYLYASWSERPAVRLARLAQRRLQARGGFRDVTLAEAGVAPDLLLTLTLDRLDHVLTEHAQAPEGGESWQTGGVSSVGDGGQLDLVISATLVDWHARRPIAWHRFSAVEPVATADAAGAVAAAGRAAEIVLEQLAPWVEAAAAGSLPGAGPGDAATAPGSGASAARSGVAATSGSGASGDSGSGNRTSGGGNRAAGNGAAATRRAPARRGKSAVSRDRPAGSR